MNDVHTELAATLDKIGSNFEEFKARNNETVENLKKTVDRLETKLARPGAFPTSGNGDSGAPRMLKTQDGREFPFLRSEQKLADMYRGNKDDDFSIGEFCRASMLGR